MRKSSLAGSWSSTAIGNTAARWLVPQPSLDTLVTAAGLPAAGERRADFLVTGPGQRPFVIEIDGAQHESSELVDDDRDALLEEAGYEVVRTTAGEVRSGSGLGLDEIEGRWASVPSKSGRTHQRLVWAPAQVHRAVLALLDGLSVGFLTGDRWVIAIEDPLAAVLDLLPPYLDVIAAIDQLWGGTVAPHEVVLVDGERRRHLVLSKAGYREEPSVAVSDLQPDLTIRLESNRGPMDRLDAPPTAPRSSFEARSCQLTSSIPSMRAAGESPHAVRGKGQSGRFAHSSVRSSRRRTSARASSTRSSRCSRAATVPCCCRPAPARA